MVRGLFIGRFQPFHLGHLHLIKEVCKEVNSLIIVIGSSQEKNTKENPFSAIERVEMINLVLPANRIIKYQVYTIPDYADDEKWTKHIEDLVLKFDVIYMSDKDTLGEQWIEKCFKEKYQIKKIKYFKTINSTTIREKMKNNKDWRNLVPKEIFDYINKNKLY